MSNAIERVMRSMAVGAASDPDVEEFHRLLQLKRVTGRTPPGIDEVHRRLCAEPAPSKVEAARQDARFQAALLTCK